MAKSGSIHVTVTGDTDKIKQAFREAGAAVSNDCAAECDQSDQHDVADDPRDIGLTALKRLARGEDYAQEFPSVQLDAAKTLIRYSTGRDF